MTVTTDHNRIEYLALAGQTVFPYDFLVLAAADLLVYQDGVLVTGYTVSNVGHAEGGNVTFSVPMAGGEEILLIRATDMTQQVDLLEGSKLPSDPTEGMWDKLHLITQDLDERINRSIAVPITSDAATVELPDPNDPANQNKAVFINGSGDLEMRTVTSTDIASPISAKGDLIQGSNSHTPEKLPIGSAGQKLTVVSGKAGWVTDPVPVLTTLVDAKGDLLVATAADTLVRKPVGADLTLLAADPAQPDGISWRAPSLYPGDDYWDYARIEDPPNPAVNHGRMFASAFHDGLARPSWKDTSGTRWDLNGSVNRMMGAPYKDVLSTAVETSIYTTPPTIPGNLLGTERGLHLKLFGDLLNNTGVNRGFTLKFKFGGTTFATLGVTGAFAFGATRYGWAAEANLVALGSTALQFGDGYFRAGNNGGNVSGGNKRLQDGTTTMHMSTHNALAIDSTVDQTFDITVQPEVSSANLSFRVFAVFFTIL